VSRSWAVRPSIGPAAPIPPCSSRRHRGRLHQQRLPRSARRGPRRGQLERTFAAMRERRPGLAARVPAGGQLVLHRRGRASLLLHRRGRGSLPAPSRSPGELLRSRYAALPASSPRPRCASTLIGGLWGDQAVGIVGGQWPEAQELEQELSRPLQGEIDEEYLTIEAPAGAGTTGERRRPTATAGQSRWGDWRVGSFGEEIFAGYRSRRSCIMPPHRVATISFSRSSVATRSAGVRPTNPTFK
jgi:hypothetical protein